MTKPISIREMVAQHPRLVAVEPDVTGADLPQRVVDPVAFRRERGLGQFATRLGAEFQRFAQARAGHPEVLAWVDRQLANPAAGESLMLLGGVGTGKTHEAIGAIRALVESGRRALDWRAVSETGLFAATRPRSDDLDPEQILASYADAGLLLLDDLGAAKTSAWTQEQIYRLVNHRYGAMLPMLVTANLSPEDVRERVGDRVSSRLRQMCTVVYFEDEDRRRPFGHGGAR